jgi:hypothetical protein
MAIEAGGIKTYHETINSSLTEQVLRSKGIEATAKLAASPNAKVVVIGSGKDGLPIILGGDNGVSSPIPATSETLPADAPLTETTTPAAQADGKKTKDKDKQPSTSVPNEQKLTNPPPATGDKP